MKTRDIIVEAVQGGTAVVGWGRGMGHKGHMLLARAVIVQAQQMNAQPLFFVSQTMGKDDPLTPEEKLGIYKKVFPKYANIFQTGAGIGQLLSEVAKSYPNVILVLGEDQVQAFQFLVRPDKSGNVPFKTYGLNDLKIIARQQVKDPAQQEAGPRATPMREVLMDPNATDEQKFAMWRRDMPDALSDRDVMSLMKKAQQRLTGTVKEGVLGFVIPQQPTKQVKKPVDDFEARLLANREKKQQQQNKEKVYHGKHEYWADKGEIEEMDKGSPQPGRDGKVSHKTYGSRDNYKLGHDKEFTGKAMKRDEIIKRAYDIAKKQGIAEADKHSFMGKIQRGHQLRKKVDSSFNDIGDAQQRGDKEAGSKAFRKHERYANLERPGTWTKVKDDMSEASNPVDTDWYRKQQERQTRAKQKQQGVAENSMADFFTKAAQEKFPHATIRKNGQTVQEPPKREPVAQEPQQPVDIDKLKQRYYELKKQYENLGGDSWQYADRMMDRDREAQAVGRELRSVMHQIKQALGHDIEEGRVPSGLTWSGGKLKKRPELVAAAKAQKNYKAAMKRKADKEKASQEQNTEQDLSEIAGAFPSPSTREKWAKDAAASNAAEARRQEALKAQQLEKNNAQVDREQKINYHSLDGEAVPPKTNEARKASTKTARKEFGNRTKKPTLSDKEQQSKQSESDKLWAMLQQHIANAEKNKEQGVAEDWQKTNKQDKTDGMSPKAVKAYRRENPGSKLQTAVTKKPSELKAGSKDAKRRKSFCARMSGMKKAHASAKTKRDPDSPINKALRRWNCESVEQLEQLVMIAEQNISEARMSSQVKLQRAFQREQERGEASRKRGEELLNPKKEEPKKEVKESLANLVNRMRPLMAEATDEQKVKLLQLMKEAKVDLGAKMQKKAERLRKNEDSDEKDAPRSKRDEVAEDNDPCWDGYKQIGMKKKGGKKVPNCVPTNETALKDKQDLDAKRKALQDMDREPGHDKDAVRQAKLDLEKQAKLKGLAEDYLDE